MLFGWIFLNEHVSVGMLLAAVVIVLGCALTTRAIDPSSRRTNSDLT
jgi:drug/metabolite transporter (DMT)-like permease